MSARSEALEEWHAAWDELGIDLERAPELVRLWREFRGVSPPRPVRTRAQRRQLELIASRRGALRDVRER
jgi:hypothetical protein